MTSTHAQSHRENTVKCDVCGDWVLAVEIQARRDPRLYSQWEGEALLCLQCAFQLDHAKNGVHLGRSDTGHRR